MKYKIILIAAVVAFGGVQQARAQWVQTALTDEEITSFAINDTILIAGSYNFGVFCTSNNGLSWTGGAPNGNSVLAIVSSGINLFAGTEDSGVFLSTDGGISWTNVSSGLTNNTIGALAVNGSSLFAGTGDLISGKKASGVFHSTDNGRSWINIGLTNYFVDILLEEDSNLYAGTLGNGIFRSTNNGSTWVATDSGLTNDNVFSLCVSGSDFFAGTENGLFLSTNNGVIWTEVQGLPADDPVQAIVISGTCVFAGTYAGAIFFSTDNGANWTNVGYSAGGGVKALAILGQNVFTGFARPAGVVRSSLSDLGISAVSPTTSINNFLTIYPNPFTQSTTINFTTPESGVADVSLVNILGTEVARVFSGVLSAGEHSFTWDANGLPRGCMNASYK